MADMARAINPDLDVVKFPDGISASNLDAFLEGVDVFVDGLDFFAFEIREKTFAACYAKGIPAVTVAPIGMGAAMLNFLPGRMTFEQYFRFEGASEPEKALRFLLGVAPTRCCIAGISSIRRASISASSSDPRRRWRARSARASQPRRC
jgi:molybdopterin/thiamine biosynthesis adenylyltransferase